MPKFKVLIDDEQGRPVEDTADGTFREQEEAAAEFLAAMEREMTAQQDIFEVREMIAELNGVLADETVTREQAAVCLTLAVTDVIRAFRDWIDEQDLSPSDKAMLIDTGRELVTEIGADLDRVARLLVGAETSKQNSTLN